MIYKNKMLTAKKDEEVVAFIGIIEEEDKVKPDGIGPPSFERKYETKQEYVAEKLARLKRGEWQDKWGRWHGPEEKCE